MTDQQQLDLTPIDHPQAPKRSWRNWLVMGIFAVAAGFILFQALAEARVFFLNVDEAVAQRVELADETFRMQGTVITEARQGPDGELLFTISYGGVNADVRHVGDEPSDLFRLDEQVVVEGRWVGQIFESSQILVKHSEEYVEGNPDRVEYDLDETLPDDG
ncbi:MAG: cytochrome c maturation protein CcmE [Actinomycetota bacterium]